MASKQGTVFPVILGLGLAAFVFGGLAARVGDRQDVLPEPVEALILGFVFALASMPSRLSILPRLLLPVPGFLLFLLILTGRNPPMPFPIAFTCALLYSFSLTAYTAYLAERSRRRRAEA